VVRFEETVRTSDVAQNLTGAFGEAPQVVTFGSDNQVRITTKYKIGETGVDDEVETALYNGLKPMLPADVPREMFLSDYRKSSETVGPTIAADIKNRAIWAVGLSLVIMFLYIFMRFKNWQYGFGAMVAVAHDVMIVIGIYSLLWGILPFTMEIDQSFIAAILTVMGYSVNDTVVVFDRLREFLPLHRKRPVNEVINLAMNDTLSRTLNTGITTILVLIVMFFFGGATIRGFLFAMIIGIIVGTYSSIFIASSIVYDTTRKSGIKT
jgi:SecD/SecF fusion protein